jgi:protein-disulfide isomerase
MKILIPLLAVLAAVACDKLPTPPSPIGTAAAALDVKPAEACDVHPGTDTTRVFQVPIDQSPVLGDASAPVTIVEFSDYQCPFCGRAHQTVEALLQAYGAKIRLVMKQAPLPMHTHARAAALAALAAAPQGQFWPMHRALFANQGQLDDTGLEGLAEAAHLDVTRWRADMAAPTTVALLEKDQALGKELGVSGTPTFFINGRKLVGAQPVASFKAIIDEELEKSAGLIRHGVKPEEVYAKVTGDGCTQSPPPDAAAVQTIEVGNAPTWGSASAPVTLVVYSDFQCPFCGRYAQTLKAIESQYAGRVRIAFKEHPLPFHDKARLAAAASLAANDQGHFWEYHDLLFAHQDALDRASLEGYAQQLGLDLNRFRSDMDSSRTEAQITQDGAEASRVGALGTPATFVNGHPVVGAQPLSVFEGAIEAELQKASHQ